MKKIVLLLVGISLFAGLNAQTKFTLSGYVKDADTGEELIGATVAELSLSAGTLCNVYGFYSLTLPAGKHSIQISFIGYEPVFKEIDLKANMSLNVNIKQKSVDMEEVLVTADGVRRNVESTEMSVAKLTVSEIENVPILFGEKDILKTIQLLPGVSAAGEGNSGFYVRGGSADQNLILLDEAPVYNASHLLGFFSVFNSDALKDMTLYKGGIPAQFGGRASSVLDVYMQDGNKKEYKVSGGIGLISSRLTFEGPVVKDKSSVIVSARRTYADMLLQASGMDDFKDLTLYFWDLNAKFNYTINQNNRIFLSGYFGRDNFGMGSMAGVNWGNATGTFRWNHNFSSKLFSNTSLIYSEYDYAFAINRSTFDINLGSGITDYNVKQDFTYYMNPNNTMRFGFNGIYHVFNPGEMVSDNASFNNLILPKRFAFESAAYFSNDHKITETLSLNYGLRFSDFMQLGEGMVYKYDDENNRIDSTFYGKNKQIINYKGWEPRISATVLLNENSSVKASYNRMFQYMHLLSNNTSSTPTDLWMPASTIIKPLIADQFALGYFRNFNENQYEASIETYYKKMQNYVDYENGADILLNADIESQMIFGTGVSYGAEFFLKKKTGKFTGWVSYTLSRTELSFDEISKGKAFPAKQDRTHEVSVVAMYKLNNKWSLSSTWVYQTGNAVTFPSGKYTIGDQTVSYFTERNGYRMPDYHRLDLGATWQVKKTDKFESSWTFSVYNAYNRKNAYSISFQESETKPGTTEAVRLSLFGAVPSVTWNFKF